MGRDIYYFVERRKGSGKWECVLTDEDMMLRRCSEMFAILSYNAYESKEGVKQKTLKDWVFTLSPQARKYMFMRLRHPMPEKAMPCPKTFDYNEFSAVLDDASADDEQAKRWYDEGLSFFLSDKIISSPDACFWNWCSAEELEWAIALFVNNMGYNILEDYEKISSFMRSEEESGYEVRMVYSYDFSTRWLDQGISEWEIDRKLKGEQEMECMKDVEDNLLIRYIIQCRPQEFIDCFEKENNRCFLGIYTLYEFAYANYLLLSDEDWYNKNFYNDVVIPCRDNISKILRYLESIITIPDSLDSDFKSLVRQYSYYDSDDDLDYVFDNSLNGLIQKGYREIDCRLYLAGMSLDYEETERLLLQGGNPDKRILGYISFLDADNTDNFDIQCLSSDVETRYADAIDCYDLSKYWESGVKGQDMIVNINQITNVWRGAAYILMARLIRKYKHA